MLQFSFQPTKKAPLVMFHMDEYESKLREKLMNGEFDSDIFGSPANVTPEITHILGHPILGSIFIDLLFIKSKSKDSLEFWYHQDNIRLPRKPIELALSVKSNLSVFQFLKEVRVFDRITEENKIKFIKNAESLKLSTEVVDFLKTIECKPISPVIKF